MNVKGTVVVEVEVEDLGGEDEVDGIGSAAGSDMVKFENRIGGCCVNDRPKDVC